MKKWEYLVVYITEGTDGSLMVSGWPTLDIRGRKWEPSINKLLDDLGWYGWELIGFERHKYVFKREVIDK